GATNAGYFSSNVQAPQFGAYDVVVSDAFSSLTSRVATLTINVRLVILVRGDGIVTNDPAGTLFPSNSIVTLTATPNRGFAFFDWSGDATGNANPLHLKLDSNKTVTANFVPTPLHLTATTPGGGVVNQAPGGSYYVGATATFSASP